MFTIAEQRALDQLSTPAGHLAILAADQRTKLVAARTAAGLPDDMESLREFKLDLVEALAALAPAVLLDPEIGLPHVLERRAFPARTGLLVSLERSGAIRTPAGLRAVELLPGHGAAGVRRLGGTGAKLLVRLRADREDADGANAAVIRSVATECAAADLALVVEVLTYRLDDEDEADFARRRADLIREGALLAEAAGARYLKLEYAGDEAACAAVTDALGSPWALLSAGVDHQTFVGQLREAFAGGASGFIAGRSIWKEAVAMDRAARREFLGGEARRRLEELLAMVG
jgi:tagatose 1,6-diphosphate aldolase